MITLTIDNKSVTVAEKTTILEAAKTVGIDIPTMCYHARLSPIGSCRVCLVRVKGIDEPVASCTTPVTKGMEVITHDEELQRLRKQNIQFLLVNHPLECPICDKAGECDLQDLTYKFDIHKNEYALPDVVWDNHTRSPLVFRSDGRCIRCGRCVAICAEVQNRHALDFFGRGYDAKIGPTTGEFLDCEFCGQCVSVCPVGALILKPFHNQMRVWDLKSSPSVCSFCAGGCEVNYQHHNGRIYRAVSDRETTHNHGDLCARGIFGFHCISSPDRITSASVDGEDVPMAKALDQGISRLQKVLEEHGPSAVAAIGSGRLTNRDSGIFARFIRQAIGTPNLDTDAGLGYRQLHAMMPEVPKGEFNDLEDCDVILVFGSDMAVEMPVPSLRVIAAAKQNDAKIIAAAPYRTKLHNISTNPMIYSAGTEDALAIALNTDLKADSAALSEMTGISQPDLENAKALIAGAQKLGIIIGPYAYRSENASKAVANLVSKANPAVCLLSSHLPNLEGVIQNGCVPGSEGKGLVEILSGIKDGTIKALWINGDIGCIADTVLADVDKLELLVAHTPLSSELTKAAHVVLPGRFWVEKGGEFTSAEGRSIRFERSIDAPAELLDAPSVYFALADRLGKGLDASPMKGLEKDAEAAKPVMPSAASANGRPFTLVQGRDLFITDAFSQRSEPLRKVRPGMVVNINPNDLKELGVNDGETVKLVTENGTATMTATEDENMPQKVTKIIAGFGKGQTLFLDAYHTKADIEKG